jgi:anti-sigma regulatory factor (Ser/Thr protein kinase)
VEDSVGQGVRSVPGRQPGGRSAPVLGSRSGLDLIDRVFGREEITLVRHEVSGSLSAAGLGGDRLHGFVLAVNEVVTNVVLHAGGQGHLTLRLVGDSAWCTVTDSGPGIPAHHLSGPELSGPAAPGAFEVGGRGIWLAYQLCDEVTMATGPIGTTIGLRIALDLPREGDLDGRAVR